MTGALAGPPDLEVKALLKQLLGSIRVATAEESQRDKDLQTVIALLATYGRDALALHYGAPPWPEGWP